MPKKKKKSRDTGLPGRALIEDQNVAAKELAAASSSVPERAFSAISVRVTKSSTPPVKTLRYEPTIVLNDADAVQLGVMTDDSVMLLMTNQLRLALKLQGAAIARVHTASNASTPPPSPLKRSPGLQRSRLSPGCCHIFPESVALELNEKDPVTAEMNSDHESPASLTTPTRVSSPSPSKSRFSFAKGGGGEGWLSPSLDSSSLSSSPSRIHDGRDDPPEIWVIPQNSALGEKITSLLCRDAQKIVFREDDDNPSSRDDFSGPLARRMILAHTCGSYLRSGTKLSVSFQGRSRILQVTEVEGVSKATDKELADGLARLALFDEDAFDSNAARLLEAIQSRCNSEDQGSTMFRVKHDTQVHMEQKKTTTGSITSLGRNIIGGKTSSVAGLDEVKEKVIRLISTPMLQPELFPLGLKPPRGLLIHGPGGSGKSSLAKSIAQKLESNFHVEYIHCTALQARTALVGDAERGLARVFQSADQHGKGKSGSVIFFDDVHLICSRREGARVGADRLSATLLALLDGIDSANKQAKSIPQFIIGITSNPSLLDPALRRPGRLDSEIEVPLPDEPKMRSHILQSQVEEMYGPTLLSDEEWLSLATQAKGFTGADLKLAVKDALRRSQKPEQEPTAKSGFSFDCMLRAIRAIKPSAIKSVSVEIPRVHWSSIGGMESVKRQLREAIELPQTHRDMFRQLGIRPPRGILLYGPPGCSKTLMARALATEGHMNFLAVKGPELLSKWLGESERALASLFKRARLASPSVIFFDEVDAIASKRGGTNSGGERLLSQLLTEIDGIHSNMHLETTKSSRVVVVCATNRPDLLDGALMRPGRIDKMIYVGVPDAKSREKIIEIGLVGKVCSDDIKFEELAQDSVSGGLSGAELVSSCRDAALLAIEDSEGDGSALDPTIRKEHMVKALGSTKRQVTSEMVEFYDQFRRSRH